jgi:quinol monooxygenase YgiN
MITVIATVKAKPGKGAELEADFRAYAEQVKANEPGTLLYTLNRSREDADTFYAIEIYADEAAVQTHMKNFQARQGAPDVAMGPPQIQVLDRLV